MNPFGGPRPATSPLCLSQTLAAVAVYAAALWWGCWFLLAAAPARPADFFPMGRLGLALLSASAAAVIFVLVVHRRLPWPSTEAGGPVLDRRDTLSLGLAAGLIVLFWWKVFLRGWLPLNALMLEFFHPRVALVCEALQGGLLPLWNPWGDCGMPLMADPQAQAFYPLQLPLHLAGAGTGFRAWLFLHLFFLFSFTYLWLRDRALSVGACRIGGVLAVFSVYVTWHAGYLSHLSSLVWTPFLWHMWERRRWSFLALGAALQVLAGHPQFHYMTLLGIALFLAVERPVGSVWLKTAGFLAAGYLLAAFQLAPFLELAAHATRSGPLDYAYATRFSQPPLELLKALWLPPWITGGPPAEAGDPYLLAFYAGPLCLGLAGWGLVKRRGKEALAAGLLGLSGLLLSLGHHFPLYAWLYRWLPGLNLFRFPAQWTWLAVFGVTLLAAGGATRLSPRANGILLAFLTADLFLCASSAPYVYVNAKFLSSQSPRVAALRAAGGRVMQTPRLQDWMDGKAGSAAPGASPAREWTAAQENLISAQAWPFHIPEAKSFTVLKGREIDALHRLAAQGGDDGVWALKEMGVRHLVDLSSAAADGSFFVWRPAPTPFARFHLPSGVPAPVEVLAEQAGALRLRLSPPPTADRRLMTGNAFYPGWHAFSRGEARPVVKDEVAFQGVDLRKGDEEVLIRYDAPPFLWGLLVSFLTCAAFFGRAFLRRNFSAPLPPLPGKLLTLLGAGTAAKALYDLAAGQPYANAFSAAPWEFVPARAFVRFALAEGAAGLLMTAVGLVLSREARVPRPLQGL